MMTRLKEPIVLPELGSEAYLFEVFQETGYLIQSPMGEAPLDMPTMEAYCRLFEMDLENWELKTIFRMSQAYLLERQTGEEPFAKPPHDRMEENDA